MAVCAMQKQALREQLQGSQQKLETASNQLQALSRGLGVASPAQLDSALQDRLSRMADTYAELRSTVKRLEKAQAAEAEVGCIVG